MIWDDQQSADDLKKKSFEKIIYLTKGIEDRNRVIGNNKTSEDRKTDLNEQISGMMDRIGELGNSMNDIDQLGADQDHTYVLNDGGTGDLRPVGNVTETDAKNKIVSINATTNGLAFHEIRHVSQSLNAGGLKFIDGKLQNAGTTRESQGKMEVGAYQSQFSYTGYRIGGKTVYTPYAITPEFVGSLKNEKGELFYPFMNSLK